MCQDKVVDGVKLAFTRGLKYRLQIVDISDIEFVVSHHGDYIRKDHPILLKSNTEHFEGAYKETRALYIEIFICDLPVGRGRDNQ